MPKSGVAIMAAALLVSACAGGGGENRFPTSRDYPPGLMMHGAVEAVQGWKLATLETPDRGAWRVVVITGTPSWSEYWAPVLAAMPEDFSMVVADRPGFAASEPKQAVGSIDEQARALSALLPRPEDGRRTLLVGQSYGAAISIRLAEMNPDAVDGVLLVSPFMGQRGRTANTLMTLGAVVGFALPRDLKNARAEVRGQAKQLPAVRETLSRLKTPVAVLHGDADTFVPITSAETLVRREDAGPRLFIKVEAGDHFLNACCVPALVTALEQLRGMVEDAEAS
ncbi:alpha/beta fold hydrolase [bacterium]|nr:alpha/beta fold hydrolase [bacterium]